MAPVALTVGGLLTMQTSLAAFTATTTTSASWAAGTVSITDDDAGAAAFTVSGLVPGNSGSKCILVTYSGNVNSSVKLYVSASAGSLPTYLNVTVSEGTGATFAGGCGAFVSTSTLYSGTLAAMAAANNTYGSGLSSWAPDVAVPASLTKAYQIDYSLPSGTTNAAQGTSATATFTWEADSR